MKFKYLSKDKISQLPKSTGVYCFKSGKDFLYIGKAANIKERVKNHLERSSYRDGLFINQIEKIGYIKTDSTIEALILEANLIKKHQPKYNIVWRDDKNYFYVGITKEDLPMVFITHQIKKFEARNPKSETNSRLEIRNSKFRDFIAVVGPFVEGTALKKALRILRKVFPYYTVKKHPQGLCPWCYLDLCPGPNPDKKKYQKDIKNLISILSGKSQSVLKNLKREMKNTSQKQEFEEAAKIRDQIESLEKILAHAKIFSDVLTQQWLNYQVWEEVEKKLKKILNPPAGGKKRISRIEAYDISNIQGKEATGSMITFIQGIPEKNFYRRFKIRIAGKPNDIAMIKETLKRRLKHKEWSYPNLILIDGGKGQLNVAKKTVKNKMLVIALAKRRSAAKSRTKLRFGAGENKLYIENRKKPILLKNLPREIFNLILQLRDEAHRFAIAYHRKLRRKQLLKK